MWKKIPQLYVKKRLSSCLSSCPSYQLFVTFLPKKQHLSPAKIFNSPSVCVENKSPRPSALRTETSVNFPLENSLHPHGWGSQTASSLKNVTLSLSRMFENEVWMIKCSFNRPSDQHCHFSRSTTMSIIFTQNINSHKLNITKVTSIENLQNSIKGTVGVWFPLWRLFSGSDETNHFRLYRNTTKLN